MSVRTLTNAVDASIVTVVLGTVSELLPPIAALIAIVLGLIRIYEWSRVRVFGRPTMTEELKDVLPESIVKPVEKAVNKVKNNE